MEKSNFIICDNDTCPLRESCLRFNAIPKPNWQRYRYYDWDEDNEGVVFCEDYIDIKEYPTSEHYQTHINNGNTTDNTSRND